MTKKVTEETVQMLKQLLRLLEALTKIVIGGQKMAMTVYKLSGTAAQDNAANLDIQLDGRIVAVHMSAQAGGVDAVNEGCRGEVSFLSTNTFETNDSRGSIYEIQLRTGVLTSGGLVASANVSISGLSIPIAQGERIFLHIGDFGTLTGRNVVAYLYIEDSGIPRQAAKRR